MTQEQANACFGYFKIQIELEDETKLFIDKATVRFTGADTLLDAKDLNIALTRLIDHKKQILALKLGLNQTEIATRLTELEAGKTSQAISKTLISMKLGLQSHVI